MGWLAGACTRDAGEVALWLGGDLHLGDRTGPVLEGLSPHLRGATGIANLEGPVGEVAPCTVSTQAPICLVNAPRALEAVHRAGLRVLGIANNHAADLGADAPARTARTLSALGLGVAGEPAGPAWLVRAGRGVAVTAHDLSDGPPPTLRADLAQARARADDLVATFHVTGPPSYLPRPELKRAVAIALEVGARVVAAHGSHALGPVERRGEAVVAWGLGNLRFTCDCTKERDALLLRVTLGRGPVEAVVIPIDAGLRGEPARPASDPALIFDLLAALGSSPLERAGVSAARLL